MRFRRVGHGNDHRGRRRRADNARFWLGSSGTDNYGIDQANSSYTSTTDTVTDQSYSLDLTDTVSSSWHDDGTDDLTDNDSLTGETDD